MRLSYIKRANVLVEKISFVTTIEALHSSNMASTLSLCTFLLVLVVAISARAPPTAPPPYQPVNTPVISITRSKEMTAMMQLDAVDAFKRAYTHLTSSTDRCSIVRQIFLEKYPDYKWHVAMYRAFSIQSIKSIDVKVNQDNYVLFATKK